MLMGIQIHLTALQQDQNGLFNILCPNKHLHMLQLLVSPECSTADRTFNMVV